MVDNTLFQRMAPGIMKKLMADFELSSLQAAGVLGNLGHECGGFHLLHEIGKPENQGGYGWAQWTGPRRKAFFAWCKNNKMAWSEPDANYGFLKHELDGDESGAVSAVLKTFTLDEAVVAFERNYERSGIPNYPSRIQWAETASAAFKSV